MKCHAVSMMQVIQQLPNKAVGFARKASAPAPPAPPAPAQNSEDAPSTSDLMARHLRNYFHSVIPCVQLLSLQICEDVQGVPDGVFGGVRESLQVEGFTMKDSKACKAFGL
eukprot:g11767.t1